MKEMKKNSTEDEIEVLRWKLAEAKRFCREAVHIARNDRDDVTEADLDRIVADLEALG